MSGAGLAKCGGQGTHLCLGLYATEYTSPVLPGKCKAEAMRSSGSTELASAMPKGELWTGPLRGRQICM